jgi:hypothetical protein
MKKLSFALVFALSFLLFNYSAYAATLEDLANYFSSLFTSASDAIIGATTPSCRCNQWKDQECGTGDCKSYEMYQTRNCNPSGCRIEKRCIASSDCPACSKVCRSKGYYNGKCGTGQCAADEINVGQTRDCKANERICCCYNKCTDSDNGKKKDVKGTVTKGSISKTDECTSCTTDCPEDQPDQCRTTCDAVKEYYCSEANDIAEAIIKCGSKYTCEDGACVPLHDVAVISLSAPSNVNENEKFIVNATVTNLGNYTETVGVELSACRTVNEKTSCKKLYTNSFSLDPDKSQDAQITTSLSDSGRYTLKFTASISIDSKKSNNYKKSTLNVGTVTCKDKNGVCILDVPGYGICPNGYSAANYICPHTTITKCCVPS